MLIISEWFSRVRFAARSRLDTSRHSRPMNRQWYVAVLLFGAVFGVYAASPVTQSMDSRWTMHTALSLLGEGDVDLDEFIGLIPPDDYRIVQLNGHFYPFFPLGPTLMATPLVLPYALLQPDIHAIEASYSTLEKLCASILTALAVVIVYLTARSCAKVPPALLIALSFAFTTSAWSTASRALWQHGPSMLLLAVALYLLVLAQQRSGFAQYAALPLALSYAVRPTNIISIVVLTGYVLLCHKKQFARYVLWASLVAIPFVLFNLNTHHAVLPPYYLSKLSMHSKFGEALLGNLISPSRGLLLLTPVLMFVFYSIWLKLRTRRLTPLDGALLAIIFLHWVTISSFPHWWAGHSFGPRFFSDMLPYLSYLLIPALVKVTGTAGHRLTRYSFVVAFVFGFGVHSAGALQPSTLNWSVWPENIDSRPSRVWDWTDPQFLRGSIVGRTLLPPQLKITPAEAVIWYRPGEDPQAVELLVTSSQNSRFFWEASASLEVRLTPSQDIGTNEVGLTVYVDAARYPPGSHDLGDIFLSAQHSKLGRKRLVAIPIRLFVGTPHVIFLPIVLDAG